MAFLEVLHHAGSDSGGLDWFDVVIGVVVLAVLVGVGFLLYKMVQRRGGDGE